MRRILKKVGRLLRGVGGALETTLTLLVLGLELVALSQSGALAVLVL